MWCEFAKTDTSLENGGNICAGRAGDGLVGIATAMDGVCRYTVWHGMACGLLDRMDKILMRKRPPWIIWESRSGRKSV